MEGVGRSWEAAQGPGWGTWQGLCAEAYGDDASEVNSGERWAYVAVAWVGEEQPSRTKTLD